MMFRPLLAAIALLTRIPMPTLNPLTPHEWGKSVLFYPVVGLLIGCLLTTIAQLPLSLSEDLRAALILMVWVWITGGLHLDGLADTADAWVGGMGDRKKTLTIMKDIHTGSAAVTTLIVHLILKYAALKTLLPTMELWTLILPPVIARGSLLLLFLTTPYVNAQGMGKSAADHVPKKTGSTLLIFIALAVLFLPSWVGVKLILLGLSVFFFLRHHMLNRLGGTTGDSAGAQCELLESVLLVGLAVF